VRVLDLAHSIGRPRSSHASSKTPPEHESAQRDALPLGRHRDVDSTEPDSAGPRTLQLATVGQHSTAGSIRSTKHEYPAHRRALSPKRAACPPFVSRRLGVSGQCRLQIFVARDCPSETRPPTPERSDGKTPLGICRRRTGDVADGSSSVVGIYLTRPETQYWSNPKNPQPARPRVTGHSNERQISCFCSSDGTSSSGSAVFLSSI
jgi:hypothetical protein